MEEKRIFIKKIDPSFLDFVNYGVCSALSRTYGKEAAEKLFRLAGEIEFQELKKMISFEEKEPYIALKRVGEFLEKMGYMAKIKLTKVEENEVIIEMYGVSVIKSSKRLTNEGASPSHFMTNLMFATLKDLCDIRAEIKDLTLEIPAAEAGYAREKWTLRKIEKP